MVLNFTYYEKTFEVYIFLMQCGYFQTLVSILILQSVNSANKDGRNQKAEFIGMIEAAKSKMHQVRLTPVLFLRWRK